MFFLTGNYISGLPHVLYFLYFLYFGKNKNSACIFLYLVDLSCIALFFRYIAYQNKSCLFYSLKKSNKTDQQSLLDFT